MAADARTQCIETEIPAQLFAEIQSLVNAGWFRSVDDVVLDALRRFLDSHREELIGWRAFFQGLREDGREAVEGASFPQTGSFHSLGWGFPGLSERFVHPQILRKTRNWLPRSP